MRNSIQSRLSWRLTYALVLVFLVENVFFILYHIVEYWGDREELIEDVGEFGVLFLINLMSLPLLLLLARYLIRRELDPLEQAAEAAASIQQGELSRRIDVQNPPEEIDKLATVFNAAFDRYHGLLEQAHQFNMDASHQLRTPLAIMRTTGEVALSQDREDREYREVIGSMLEETDHLHKIVTQLLELARIPNQKVEMKPVNMKDLFNRVIDRFGPVLEVEPDRVRIDAGEDVSAVISETLMIEALSNLLDNALTHTSAGQSILLRARAEGDTAVIEVCDSGPGIPPEMIDRLTDRFYQGREGSGKGSGLGLAIVKAIAELHGGSVRIDSVRGRGTTVGLYIPVTG